jgi:hypothetical protein
MTSAFAHAVRIRPAWLRCPLVSLTWAHEVGGKFIHRALTGKLSRSFFETSVAVFCVAWDGLLVPKD